VYSGRHFYEQELLNILSTGFVEEKNRKPAALA
jgi:hypothetical protein